MEAVLAVIGITQVKTRTQHNKIKIHQASVKQTDLCSNTHLLVCNPNHPSMNAPLPITQAACGDDHDPSALTALAAKERIFAAITPLATDAVETLPLLEVLDRVLAADLLAGMDVPPHPNSAMDGYALNGRDLPVDGIAELQVAGQSFAGHPFAGDCKSGECVRIMTGAVVPVGLDTVIPQEHVEPLAADKIRIDARTHAGDNVRARGEDIYQGQVVLRVGRRITAADLGLIASLGISRVTVMRRLRVAFFSTGDELRGVGEALQPGQIYDSNRYTLYAMLTHLQCQITDLGVVRDDPQALREVLQAATTEHDVIVSSGGVSVGEADHVRQVLSELGEINFWKVAMKPGRPLTFGFLGPTVFFGLPGNPVALMVTFSQFVQPALQRLAGQTPQSPLNVWAQTTTALKKRAGRTDFQRGILSQSTEGVLQVTKTGDQGSGILLSMSLANCFIILPTEATQVEAGAQVLVQPFAGFF